MDNQVDINTPQKEGTAPEGFVEDITFGDVKALFPEMSKGPLVSGVMDSSNPGIRLVSNDGNLMEMLKIVYVEDEEMARNVAEALAECDEFLLQEDGKPHPLIVQRIEWIKYMLSLMCSVKGRFADAYKQTATGVLTNAMTEKGWAPLNFPQASKEFNKTRDHSKKRP